MRQAHDRTTEDRPVESSVSSKKAFGFDDKTMEATVA